ncbi:DMT family transporter [Peribacillus cavernae]|uniref:DMT family transporter n=1 Tax=Peribacillus cavernae TaxID=1674310 RepID=A0A3S0VXJ1_9BACI|nr:DMT family transporter [Peribacillus cavernae]RUQ28296.1 DMT family transporter [Peribacillus cavernae]
MYVLLVFVMVAWGFNVSATKLLVDQFMPVTITALRISTAGISVFIILYFLKLLRLPSKKEIPALILGAILNVAGHHYFLSIGLKNTSAVNGGIILGVGPLITAILSIVLLGSRFTFFKCIGFIIGFAGVLVTVSQGKSEVNGFSSGDIDVFISIFSQSLSFILIKKVSKTMDPRLLTGYMLAIGSFLLFIISLLIEPDGFRNITEGSAIDYFVFFSSAVIATAVGHMCYNHAIGKIGAAETSVFMNLSPFFSLIGAALFLNEKIYATHLTGLVFIILGVLIGSGAYKQLGKSKRMKHKLTL